MSRFVVALDGMLDPEVCRAFINKFELDADQRLGETAAGLTLARKRSMDVDLTPDHWGAEIVFLRGAVQKAIQAYASRNESLGSIAVLRCGGFRMRRYDPPGGGFDWHIDSYDFSVASRILSCVTYLNDTGGEGATDFMYQECSVTPLAGRMLLFPSTFEYVHRSRPLTSTKKFIIVTFIEHGPS